MRKAYILLALLVALSACSGGEPETSVSKEDQMCTNQTNQELLDDLRPDELGTGLFLVPDVKSDVFGAARKIAISDITYDEALRRGAFTMGFKWVPNKVAPFSDLLEARCGQRCVWTCVELGCVCNRARGICE